MTFSHSTGTTRSRVYIVLVHKKRASLIQDVEKVYQSMSAVMRKHVRTSPQDYLIATPREILEEAAQTARTRGVSVEPGPRSTVFQQQPIYHYYMFYVERHPLQIFNH